MFARTAGGEVEQHRALRHKIGRAVHPHIGPLCLAFARRQRVSNENVPQLPAAVCEAPPLPNYVFC